MSTYETEGQSELTPDQAEQAREEREDDAFTSSGGHSVGRQPFVPPAEAGQLPSQNRSPLPVGHEEPEALTEEEKTRGRAAIAGIRQSLAMTATPAVVVRPKATTTERVDDNSREQTDRNLAALRAHAQDLARRTGISHRVTRDGFGKLVVEKVEPRTPPIGKTKRSTK